MAISLLFFSSAGISHPLLETLINDDGFEIKALFCQPDKAIGRKQIVKPTATKLLAIENGITVHQPEKLSDAEDLLEQYRNDPPDFILTFAYGQIMNQAWLDLPKLKALNVHTSLLPKYRGASPIQAAILNGDAESGITLMEMVQKMDAGPVAFQDKINLDVSHTAEKLFEELSDLAAEVVPGHLSSLKENIDQFTDQDESKVSYCEKISRKDGYIDFKEEPEQVMRRFRAYHPWPGIWTTFKGQRLKILECRLSQDPEGINVNGIEILSLQLAGKKALSAKDFLLGQSDFSSTQLPS